MKLEQLKSVAFALVLGQSSSGVISRLEGQTEHAAVHKNRDLLGLLTLIQGTCCKFETNTNLYWALAQAKTCLSLFWQEKGASIEKYKKDFKAYVAAIESYGGSLEYEEGQIHEELKRNAVDESNPMDQELKDAKLVVKNGMFVSMFISGANNDLFGDLKTELINDFTKGFDNWPINLEEAVQLINA